ncbi:TIGR01841 family phasin [Massilia sp. W12]|uniref:TIGR01841 family phasin n=1 Tax=Massilia sp. W12 TaxID=3126507 RepID=UPI0030CF2090
MFSSTDLFSHASKSYLESQLALATALTEITFSGTAKFLELELHTTRGTMAEIAIASKKISDVKNLHDWIEYYTALSQVNTVRTLEFSRQAAKIWASTLHAYAEVLEKELHLNGKKVKELVEDAVKHAPGSTPQSVAFIKSLIDTANSGVSQLAKATQETVEAFEANLISAAGQVEKSIEENIAKGKQGSKGAKY